MNYLKKFKNWIIGLFLGSVVLAGGLALPNKIPNDLKLKCNKNDIVDSQEYTEKEYNKDGEVISQKQIISYAYKSGEEAPIINQEYTEYIYETKKIIGKEKEIEKLILDDNPIIKSQKQIIAHEILEKRTYNTITSEVEVDGQKMFSVQSGYNFYKENGKWKKINFATTTSEVFYKVSFLSSFIAWAADTGATSPGTMADDSAVGTVAWVNPDNSKVDDSAYTTFTAVVSGSVLYSHWLKATNFGFSVPSGATINGILVEVKRKKSSSIITRSANIIKGGVVSSTEIESWTMWSTTENYVSIGGSENLCGETWTSGDINSSNFGFAIRAYSNTAGTHIGYINHIRTTVYYTAEGGSDTCSYSGTGDWNVNYSDNCYATTTTYVLGDFNLIYDSAGSFNLQSTLKCDDLNVGAGAIISAENSSAEIQIY